MGILLLGNEMEAGEATDKREKNGNSTDLIMGLVTAGGREKLCIASDANGNDLEVRILRKTKRKTICRT